MMWDDKRLMWWDEARWMARHCDVALGYYWLDNTSEGSSALGDPGSLSYDDTNGWMLGADCRWLGKLNIFGLQLTQVSETAENETEDKGGLPPFLGPSKCIFFFFFVFTLQNSARAGSKIEAESYWANSMFPWFLHLSLQLYEEWKAIPKCNFVCGGKKGRVQRGFFHLILKMPC